MIGLARLDVQPCRGLELDREVPQLSLERVLGKDSPRRAQPQTTNRAVDSGYTDAPCTDASWCTLGYTLFLYYTYAYAHTNT